MKILPSKIDEFLNAVPKNIRAALFYGQDESLIRSRANALANRLGNSDAMKIHKFDYNEIKENLSRVYDLMSNYSFIPGMEVIVIQGVPASINAEFKELVLSAGGNSFIVIIASELMPSSSLRGFFEKENDIAALASYSDDDGDIRRIIRGEAIKANIIISNDAIELLVARLSGASRGEIISQIQKLLIFASKTKKIEFDDVSSILADSANKTLDELCFAVASKNGKVIIKIFEQLSKSDVHFIQIIRAVHRYFTRLYNVQLQLETGKSIDSALSGLQPPLFFKHKDMFVSHVKTLKKDYILKKITNSLDAELKCKQSYLFSSDICEKFLLDL